MKRHAFSTAAFSGALLAAAAFASPAMAEEEDAENYITIGTGGQTGVYYVVGQSVCRFEDLRAVFRIHGEPLTLLAREDSGIETLDDLEGKRVNIGNPGSGQRNTMEVVMDAKGWDEDTFSMVSELDAAEQAAALSDNNIDAMVYVVGHPNGSIQEATTTVDSRLIPMNDDDIQGIVDEYPYYTSSVIPGGLYKNNPDDVETFGVAATFVTSADVDEDVVYETVKAVFDDFDRFKRLHPAFENLDEEEMVSEGLSAPLHDGAKKYYVEQGWIEE
ncbi:MAG: TAXI family TRAP transporter solute-binding subunit [Halomonas sp.]|nr:TAXI family TRAP transporter solute-binding subunit [Halomonas sp.]